ncbi:MAG: LEA type 2 family protein [Thermodesulfobacteriota bacterium]
MKVGFKYSIFIILLILPSCLTWFLEQPSFSLQEIELHQISWPKLDLILTWEVGNPNNFDLKLRSMEYAIYLQGQKVGQGHLPKEILINKSSATKVSLPLSVEIKNLSHPLGLILTGRDIPYKIEGVAILKTAIGNTTLPFAKSGKVKIRK